MFACLHKQGADATFDWQPSAVAGHTVGSAKETEVNQPKSPLSRRSLFVGAGAAGAVGAAASLIPQVLSQPEAEVQAKEPPERGGGYQLTEHVKRYYKSTLV